MLPDPRILAEDEKPTRFHWGVWAVLALGVAALVFLAIVPGVRMKMRDAAFRDIRENDPRARVVELMGAADSETDPARADLHRYWNDDAKLTVAAQDVKSVLTWRLWFPAGSVTWQVGFDNQSRAVAKHRYN